MRKTYCGQVIIEKAPTGVRQMVMFSVLHRRKKEETLGIHTLSFKPQFFHLLELSFFLTPLL